jgi:two-component system, OmpR family, sensor histidine kinase KdpD
MKHLLASTLPSRRRVVAAATIPPATAVGLALALGSDHLGTATALCLLAVVGAAALGGLRSGIVAACVSFLGLNFFFTEPRHTLIVRQASDLIALFAFLLSGLIVGALLTRTLEAQSRAERRATEAEALSQTMAKLMSGEPFDRVLDELAAALVKLFGLTRCEISTPNRTGAAFKTGSETAPPERTVTIALATPSGSFGSLTAARAVDDPAFTISEAELLRTLASQTALAIERATLDEEIRGARLEAEASRLRAALFSSVTHDLRTPLSSIKASVSGLLGHGVRYSDEQREEMLATVLEETDHLNSIVGNLLDLARMRAGDLTPAKQPIFIEEVIGSVLRRMRRTLASTPVRTNIRPNLPQLVADPVLVEQALSNVLENAARFSPLGSEVAISAARWRNVIRVRIVDHGAGIPQEERTRVFEEFYRHDAGPGRGGTGLGLAIARAVVVAHDGTIFAEGAPGGGTAIVIELPATTLRPDPVHHPNLNREGVTS